MQKGIDENKIGELQQKAFMPTSTETVKTKSNERGTWHSKINNHGYFQSQKRERMEEILYVKV